LLLNFYYIFFMII